jgi:hypothetical protein
VRGNPKEPLTSDGRAKVPTSSKEYRNKLGGKFLERFPSSPIKFPSRPEGQEGRPPDKIPDGDGVPAIDYLTMAKGVGSDIFGPSEATNRMHQTETQEIGQTIGPSIPTSQGGKNQSMT